MSTTQPLPTMEQVEAGVLRIVGEAFGIRLGAETWPMMLVSWFGADAYAAWASLRDWRDYRRDDAGACLLPAEAQWECAARSPEPRDHPSGDLVQSAPRVGCHRPGELYSLATLPPKPTHVPAGVSLFGLNHMAGNVWQWWRDTCDPGFYSTDAALQSNPAKVGNFALNSERGGSWVGPPGLARSSYRRGRLPMARGRCPGFRCVTAASNRV